MPREQSFSFAKLFLLQQNKSLGSLRKLLFKEIALGCAIKIYAIPCIPNIIFHCSSLSMYKWIPHGITSDVRVKEKKVIQRSLMAQSILSSLPQVGPTIAAALTILVMTLVGKDITVVQVCIYCVPKQ